MFRGNRFERLPPHESPRSNIGSRVSGGILIRRMVSDELSLIGLLVALCLLWDKVGSPIKEVFTFDATRHALETSATDRPPILVNLFLMI